MKTRSQTAKQTLDVNIDFDEASHYWNANKKRTGNGTYKYVCGKTLKNGKNTQVFFRFTQGLNL